MQVKSLRLLLEVAVLGVAAFAIHSLLLWLVDADTATFKYSVMQLYGCFLLGSILTTLIVMLVRQKNIDSVGSTMMLLTCGKMVPAYLIMSPVLQGNEDPTEKINFLIVFGIFLIIDTVAAIRILNSK